MRQVISGEFSLPVVGFGTYHLTDKVSEPEAVGLIHRAQDAGITLIDTSDNYRTELVVGKALFESMAPYELFIATKTGLATSYQEHRRMSRKERRADTSPERVRRQLHGSLRMLGTNMVDLYQLHAFDDITPAEDVARTMHEIVAEDRYAYNYGVSNYTAGQLEELLTVCDRHDLTRPKTSQPFYNVIAPHSQDAVVELARQEGMVVLAHSPLHKGFLSDASVDMFGNMVEDERGKDRIPGETIEVLAEATDQVQRLRQYANDCGYNLSEFAIAWLANQPQTVVLNACTTVEYIASALRASEWVIDSDGMALAREVRGHEAVQVAESTMRETAQASRYYYKKL